MIIDGILSLIPHPVASQLSDLINSHETLPEKVPFLHWHYPLAFSLIYVVSLFVLPLYMKHVRKNEPIRSVLLDSFIKFHNLFLSGLSLLMVLGFAGEAINVMNEAKGETLGQVISSVTCDARDRMGRGAIPFWLYVFYLSKYYELLDTVFLMVKCKPLTFLHTFHHVSTLCLCWYVILQKSQMMWFPSMLNAGVHVIMYYYFYVCTLKGSSIFTPGCLNVVKPWITRMQILQFVADLLVPKLWLYFKYVDGHQCTGDYHAYLLVDVVVGSFLLLFLNFYFKSYKKSGGKGKKEE
ncbi:hypothetical protein C9374_010377 [Naegleria lovaniensis]|uniref:Elongation of fatty acids protein n=1 Tax=Naegleria lovaniensis TaxID=51637 RepID=A0AA88KEH0_NAELO|nr:uncharacterized protein C9374_010377 [Naegleria lovaniensis]KAG2375003.1 hypothetical protein C9374_010377 [Naegleria lovaniensis]